MSPGEIIQRAATAGVLLTLSPAGGLSARGDQAVIDQWLPEIQQRKAAIIAELHNARRRTNLLVTLRDAPESRYAIEVVDADADPVVVSVAIRHVAVFDLSIPQSCYDSFVLLDLIEKHSGENYATP